MKNKQLILWTVFTTIWLSACSVINPTTSPAIDVYTLSPPMQSRASTETKDPKALILALSAIQSPQGFMGTDIIYRDTDYGFNRYAFSRWSDSPSKLLGSYFQQYLVQSKQLSAVIPVGSRAGADLLLEATLVDFSHHLQAGDARSTAVVSVIFYLINPRDRALLATKQITEKVSVDQENAEYAANAINEASKLVANDLQEWLEQNIKKISEK